MASLVKNMMLQEDTFKLHTVSALIKKVLPILDESTHCYQHHNYSNEELQEAAYWINHLELGDLIEGTVIMKIETLFRLQVVPQFWDNFKGSPNNKPFQKVTSAVAMLFETFANLCKWTHTLQLLRDLNKSTSNLKCEEELKTKLKLSLKAALLSCHDSSYDTSISCFYESALLLEDIDNSISKQCPICSNENCSACEILFIETNRKLVELDLLGPLTDQALTRLIYSYIDMHIKKVCTDNFDSSFIESLEKWLDEVVVRWLQKIYGYSDTSNSYIAEFQKKLKNYLYNSFTVTRIDQLFNIIIEFPESLIALQDIRTCLPKTDLKHYLIQKLQKAMETRLLHLGVSTSDILTAYVAAIRSLRVLDPSGLLLDVITQPIHQYLRRREDTVRCVVSSLTEEGPNDLAEELVRGEVVQCEENPLNEENYYNWTTWTPDSIDHQPNRTHSPSRSPDIISMLVKVYGSKEVFVNEYRTLLADRLLSQYSCDTEKEIRYLELLKLKFGDSQLHYCEVMLKDIIDSKRINQLIQQVPNDASHQITISAMILSAQFWPSFKEEKLELHPKLMEQMVAFTKEFETLKGSRTLRWKNHLGLVDLEIEVADRSLSLSVSPIHATIMMHFEDNKKWTLHDLSRAMQVPSTVLRRKIGFWQSHGLLVENELDTFVLNEKNSTVNVVQDDIIEDYEAESAMTSTQDQREEELQTFWSYIIGMLMNLDSLSLERIHQMLKMFAFQGPSVEYNIHELKVFLDKKVREHQLLHSNGLYKLPK